MISMTGYGNARGNVDCCQVDVVLKSVNHKHFLFNAHLPNGLRPFEQKFEEVVSDFVERGRVDLDLQADVPAVDSREIIDMDQAASYRDALRNMRDTLDLSGDLSVQDIVEGPGVIPDELPEDRDWIRSHLSDLQDLVREAANGLHEARRAEGRSLQKTLDRDIDRFREGLDQVEALAPEVVEAYREKLTEVLAEVTEGGIDDRDRDLIDKKIRMYIEKVDVTEEIDRLASHVEQFRETMTKQEPIGRKLDFIAQEMLRETNTIASKSKHSDISKTVVDLKTIVEGLREQTRNIE